MISADARALLITARISTGRYHGEPEWPPSPARLFQALVAGCAKSAELDETDAGALRWLEGLPPPWIAAPQVRVGRAVKLWVPNNDLDARGGDPSEVATIRTGKLVRPRIFDPAVPFLYAWRLDGPGDEEKAIRVCELALMVYQLGRGVDFASASGAIVDGTRLAEMLDTHPGVLHRPTGGTTEARSALLCPHRGSLDSIVARYRTGLQRFSREADVTVFQQAPKPSFALVAYDSQVPRAVFELRATENMGSFSATALPAVVRLTEQLRDAAAHRLKTALPEKAEDVERGLVGRAVDGRPPVDAGDRVRLIPLPSIGHPHADRGVRRVLVEVPRANPLSADDVFWAFSGLKLETPSGAAATLTRADAPESLGHYGVGTDESFVRWRTVTPAALPVARRRIEPTRQSEEAKGAAERLQEEEAARRAVYQAIRHAGLTTRVVNVHVQREPFSAKGARAEAFAPGTRFQKERLWHVELTLCNSIKGPLVLGDGRFLGLGLMEPVLEESRVMAFRVLSGLEPSASPLVVAGAMRRAVMARFQEAIGENRQLPSFVTGHDRSGLPVKDKPHLFFAYDAERARVLVLAPSAASGSARYEGEHLRTLRRSLEGFSVLLAGPAGKLILEPEEVLAERDPLLRASRCWRTLTPYVVNHHRRYADAKEAVAEDIIASCQSAGLPRPSVAVLKAWGEPGVGLAGLAELRFEVAVAGPLLLGRTRHKGGGLFGVVEERSAGN